MSAVRSVTPGSVCRTELRGAWAWAAKMKPLTDSSFTEFVLRVSQGPAVRSPLFTCCRNALPIAVRYVMCVLMCVALRPERKGEDKASSEASPSGPCEAISGGHLRLSCLAPTLRGSHQTARGTKDEAQPLRQLPVAVRVTTGLSWVELGASPVQGEAPRSREGKRVFQRVRLQTQGKLLRGPRRADHPPKGRVTPFSLFDYLLIILDI